MISPIFNPTDVGKSLFVDSVNGVDASARPYSAQNPYQTPEAAKAAAVEGDTIVVRPGTYSLPSTIIAKHGVNWLFEPGQIVSEASGPSVQGPFVDPGGGSLTYTVDGQVDITTTADTGSGAQLITSLNAGRDITFRVRDIIADQEEVGSSSGMIAGYEGRLIIHARNIHALTPGHIAVWWTNGDTFIKAEEIKAVEGITNNGIAIDSFCLAAPTGDFYVEAANIIGGNSAITISGSNADAATWVRSLIVRNSPTAPDNDTIQIFGNNKFYLETQKIFGRVYSKLSSGSLTYIRTQKWSATANGTSVGSLLNTDTNPLGPNESVVRIEAWDADPAGFTGEMFTVAGGTTEIRGMHYVANANSNGINLSDGTLRLIDCYIDTSANDSTNPIIKSGGTLELANTTLIAHSTRNCIEASTPQTANVFGVLNVNRPNHANVTIVPTTTAAPAVLTPPQITSDQNNYSPGIAGHYRLSSDATRSITGFAAGMDGSPRFLTNVGANAITLVHQSGLSTDVNRFLNSSGADVVLTPNQMASMWYDQVTQRWRVFA